jgi:HlyD family secretion protein
MPDARPSRRHSITETLAVTGSLVAREEIVVGAEVDGLPIVESGRRRRSRRKGQALARLDSTMLRTQLAQNTAAIAMAGVDRPDEGGDRRDEATELKRWTR